MGLSRKPAGDGIYMAGSGAWLLTTAEAAALLKISIRTLWRRVADGSVEVVKLGRSTRVTGDSLRAYVQAARAAAVRVAVAQAVPVTLGLLNKLACEVAERDGRDPTRVVALLAKFGVRALGDIPAERRAEFRDRLLKL